MDNFIEIYKNVFSDEFCNKAINVYKEAEKTGMLLNRQVHDGVPKTDKEDNSVYSSHFPMYHTTDDIMLEFNKVFWSDCYKSYSNKFDIINTLNHHNSYGMKIQKTKPGQGYHVWHCEATGRETSNRLLAWTVYLNDEFEAGETEFLYQHYRYKPSKGDVIIFPTAFTHAHRGNPPIGGDKYIITGWVEF